MPYQGRAVESDVWDRMLRLGLLNVTEWFADIRTHACPLLALRKRHMPYTMFGTPETETRVNITPKKANISPHLRHSSSGTSNSSFRAI